MTIEVRKDADKIQQITNIALELMQTEFGIKLKSNAEVIPTMFYCCLKAAATVVSSEKSEEGASSIDLFNLIEIGVVYDESEDGEKEGNFVPYVTPGQEFKLLVKDDGLTEEE